MKAVLYNCIIFRHSCVLPDRVPDPGPREGGTYHFDVAPPDHHSVHLLEGELRRLRQVVLDEREALVLIGDRVPRQVDALDRTERQERLLDGVLADLKVDAAHVDPAARRDGALPTAARDART